VENVMGEILDPAQRRAVQVAIDASLLTVAKVAEPREIELYAEMRRVLGDGEAASLAIAEHRGWGFVSYEGRRLAREAMTRLCATRFLRTPEVLALAAAAGCATPEPIARLRDAGLDDAAILDVAFTANLRLFGSRVYEALGVEADPFFLEQTDLMEATAASGGTVASRQPWA